MKYWIFAILLLPLFGVAFAQYDACESAEVNCMTSCCQTAGGTLTTEGDYFVCSGESENAGASTDYSNCAATRCRPALLECVAPNSGCAQEYTSCYNSCVSGGLDFDSCDTQCGDPAMTCAVDAMFGSIPDSPSGVPPAAPSGSSSCCGSAFLLGLLALGAFCRKK